jgi:myosin heavy subunit
VPINEFVRRFGLLSDSLQKDLSVETILSSNEIDSSTYRIGPSQVSFPFNLLGLKMLENY